VPDRPELNAMPSAIEEFTAAPVLSTLKYCDE
jgi:hypothetical protein